MGYIPPPAPRIHMQVDTASFMEGLQRASQSIERFKATVSKAACHYCGRGRTSGNLTCDGCGAPMEKPAPPHPHSHRRVYE